MDKLQAIQRILNPYFLVRDQDFLIEADLMQVKIKKDNCSYLLYKYDQLLLKQDGFKYGLFPFFNEHEGVKAIADYIMFVEEGQKFYVLIIELKKGNAPPKPQVISSKSFVEYIICTANRVFARNYAPKIRGIGISNGFD